jgi:hypothetical protein
VNPGGGPVGNVVVGSGSTGSSTGSSTVGGASGSAGSSSGTVSSGTVSSGTVSSGTVSSGGVPATAATTRAVAVAGSVAVEVVGAAATPSVDAATIAARGITAGRAIGTRTSCPARPASKPPVDSEPQTPVARPEPTMHHLPRSDASTRRRWAWAFLFALAGAIALASPNGLTADAARDARGALGAHRAPEQQPAGPARVLATTVKAPITPVVAGHSPTASPGRARGLRRLPGPARHARGLDTSMRDIVQHIFAAEVPVIVHISPPGARAARPPARSSRSPRTSRRWRRAPRSARPRRWAATGEDLDDKVINDAVAYAEAIAELATATASSSPTPCATAARRAPARRSSSA